MARRRHGRSAETTDFANSPTFDQFTTELLRPTLPSRFDLQASPFDNYLGDTLPHDRREFSFGEPESYSLVTAPADVSVPFSRERVAFGNPDTVAICHRRQVRREVMIAMKRRGRGGSRRRDWRSEIKC